MAENNSSAPLKTAEGTYPALPEPDTHCHDEDTGRDVWSYSAEQMRAYAAQAVEAQAAPAAVAVPDEREMVIQNVMKLVANWGITGHSGDFEVMFKAWVAIETALRAALAATPALPATEPARAAVGLTDALRDLIEAIEYTPLGIRQIKALERARAAIKTEGEISATEDSSAGDLAEPSPQELMALSTECMKLPGGQGMHYLNYAKAVLARWGSAPQAQPADALDAIQNPQEMADWLIAMRSRLGSCREASQAWSEEIGLKSWDNYTALSAAFAAMAAAQEGGNA
ncbi:hypothetical protein [Comamonas koreensis]|uniref:hypothetical protein n=1 Tax=Comamonas koreensis TaxID=160825 RepID=UPI0015FCEE52|nr:hypothetical protein [Comamonas koreensis]